MDRHLLVRSPWVPFPAVIPTSHGKLKSSKFPKPIPFAVEATVSTQGIEA